MLNEAELNQSPLSSLVVDTDSEMKDYLVEYVGGKFNEEEVTVSMIHEVMAVEFPEFVISLAEENYLIGYEQGLKDADKLSQRETRETEK